MVHQEIPANEFSEPAEHCARFWRWGWLEPLGILLLTLLLNFAGNGRTGLWDRDEPRYAVCVREMRGGATGSFRHSTANLVTINRF